MPNPWDVGSRQAAGRGRLRGAGDHERRVRLVDRQRRLQVTRDELVEHVRATRRRDRSAAQRRQRTLLRRRSRPESPRRSRLLHDAGAAGCSIEDWNGPARTASTRSTSPPNGSPPPLKRPHIGRRSAGADGSVREPPARCRPTSTTRSPDWSPIATPAPTACTHPACRPSTRSGPSPKRSMCRSTCSRCQAARPSPRSAPPADAACRSAARWRAPPTARLMVGARELLDDGHQRVPRHSAAGPERLGLTLAG